MSNTVVDAVILMVVMVSLLKGQGVSLRDFQTRIVVSVNMVPFGLALVNEYFNGVS